MQKSRQSKEEKTTEKKFVDTEISREKTSIDTESRQKTVTEKQSEKKVEEGGDSTWWKFGFGDDEKKQEKKTEQYD